MKSILSVVTGLYEQRETSRSKAFTLGRAILKNSKKMISRVHYDDMQKAGELRKENYKHFAELQKLIRKNRKLKHDGFVREGMEEFAEADLYFNYVSKGVIDLDKRIVTFAADDPDIIIAGLCDFTGELTRRAVRIASKERAHEVEEISERTNEIIDKLLEVDLAGYSRTKFDQAKRNAQRLETMLYELRIRK